MAQDIRPARRWFSGMTAALLLAAAYPALLAAPAAAYRRHAPRKAKTPQSPAETDPRAIVVEIYKVSAGADGKYSGPSAFQDERIRKLYFSKSLLDAVVAMEAKEKAASSAILGFDPITNSQDPSVKNLSVKDESVTHDKATVAATFWSYNDKAPSIIRFDFIKEGREWKLDEIRGENQNDKNSPFWSLRQLIQGG